MTTWRDPEAVRFILDDCETWAVVGLSGNPSRTAYSIAPLHQQRGKRIVPIHPDAAVAVGASAVWCQLGVVDERAFARTAAAGVPMVMDTCPAIEWRRRT